jgi:hypothetical protein
MAFNVNSPFASMSQQLYSPAATASASSAALGDLSRAFNMSAMAKNQPLNRGISQNVNAMRRGQGQYDAQRQFAPLSQQMKDRFANAQWGLGVQQANEQAGLQGLQRLYQQDLVGRQRNMTNQSDVYGILSRLFQPSELFGL